MSSLSRRQFVKSSLVAAATASPAVRGLAEVAHHGASSREPLRELAYHDVQLTGGPLKEHYDRIHAQYLALSNDSLLKVYRQRAGLPAPGADMGGWYDTDGFVPGHSLGQYVSGLARIGASTGDETCLSKVRALVGGFGETLGPKDESILRPKTNLWICYTLDKHFAGLLDAHSLAGVSEAKELMSRVLAGSQGLLPAQGRDRIGKKDPPYDETFVMPENLFAAAEATGNPAFRALAEKYLLDKELFEPLARGDDPLPGQHAYSHAIALSSSGRAYLTLGDAKYREAMRGAFRLLTTQQQFASGGWGPNETFIHPHKGELYDSLKSTVDHFETPCGSYAATKLARYLLRTDGAAGTPQGDSSAYGDNLERVLFNTILVSRDPDSKGEFFYYSTYSPSATKVYYGKKWPCCSGTLVQTVADYPLNVYFAGADGRTAVVNLYTPSEARLQLASSEVRLVQETRFPAEDTVRLSVEPARATCFALRLRMPGWLARPATVTVNGRAVEGSTAGGGYLTLERVWKSGDVVKLTLPQDFRTEAIDELHPGTVALMRGPVQYVALDADPATSEGSFPLPGDLKPVAAQMFTAKHGGQEVVYVPLYSVRSETYTSYFDRT